MKKVYSLFILGFFWCISVNAQLTSITPNQAIPGQTLLTTITSGGIFIQTGSPSGNIYQIKLTQGANTIMLYDFDNFWLYPDPNIIDPFSVIATLSVPSNAVTGLYDLKVITGDAMFPSWNQVLYTLPGSFTIAPPDGFITGTVYNDLNKNGVKDGGEPGLGNRQVQILPTNSVMNTDASGNYSFPVLNGSYSVVNINYYFDYHFSVSGIDTIQVTINNNNATNIDFGLAPALVSIAPDTAKAGVFSSHIVVSDKPIFTTGAFPYGNISQVYIYSNPGYVVPLTSAVMVIDSYTVQLNIILPSNVTIGSAVDIRFILGNPNSGYHYLRNKLITGPPDGLVKGNVYYDVNNNGLKDVGEFGLSAVPVKMLPENMVVNTNAIGDYSIGVANGGHTLSPLANSSNYMFPTTNATLPVTINYDTISGIDFGMKPALVSVTPDVGYRGLTTLHQFVSDKPIFHPGGTPYGNVSTVRIFSNPSVYPNVVSAVNVIDSFTVRVNITIPVGTAVANDIDIYFYLNAGAVGYHYLRQKFDIANPPALISGKVFFDQNLNKIYDAGEPGIRLAKLELNPDSTIAFSDYSGNYLFGSAGGIQTVSYINSNPGLVLFTDSASFTFNATGNITDKNFGLISTSPDYSIATYGSGIFARCNTQQYTTLTVRNTGNISYNAIAWIKYDPQLTYISAFPAPASISNDTIYWNVSNLLPFSNQSFSAIFLIPPAGTINLNYGATSLFPGGIPAYSFPLTTASNIFCAYDPNDKQVNPPGINTAHFTLMSDTLKYLIRFQNTGNDTAFNVVILDTIDSNLDYKTFEVLESSHSVQTQLLKNGALKFSFKNILLPDSNVNEAASHGYIQYRVKAKSGLPDSTVVYNTAHIYFDFNPDIITNTTFNTLVYLLPWIDPLPITLASFTGKARDKFNDINWVTFAEVNNAYFNLERSDNGLDFTTIATIEGSGTTSSSTQYSFKDYNISKEIYYYRLKQVDYDEDFSYSDIIHVRRILNGSGNDIIVYPNPFSNNVNILFAKQIKEAVWIEIEDMAGALLYSTRIVPNGNLILLEAEEFKFSKGIYLIKITTNSGQSVQKLIKN